MKAFIHLLFNQLGIELDGTGGGEQIVAPFHNGTGFCIINPSTFDLQEDVIAAATEVGYTIDYRRPGTNLGFNKETNQPWSPSIHFKKPRTTPADELIAKLS